jgi:hypothetical protein
MYRCEVCDRVSECGQPAKTIVVETREIEHPHREEVYWRKPKPGERKGKWLPDPGGTGTAIVRELRVCEDCHAKLLAPQRERNPDGS